MFTQDRRGRGWAAGGRAAVVVLVAAVGLTAGCSSDGSGSPGSRDSPKAADEPTPAETGEWRPWLTSFHGGDGDDGPRGGANACAGSVAPSSEEYKDERARRSGAVAQVYCDGTGFQGESLRFKDGAHQPSDRKGDRRTDFAHGGGLAFTSTDTWDKGDEGGGRLVRALDERSRDRRWEHRIRSEAVLDGERVLGDEWTEITNPPTDYSGEPWTPEFEPGGDVIAWDARSGKEKWRLKPPAGDQWCAPTKVADQVFLTCEEKAAGSIRVEVTWYDLDEKAGRPDLRELYTYERGERSETLIPLGMDGDALLFLPPKGSDFRPQSEYDQLIRVDVDTGKEKRVSLPTKAIGKGPVPYLLDGDLYFQGADADGEARLVAVDPSDGQKRWTSAVPFTYASSPTVSAERDEVYFADPAGRLVALSRKDGHQLWKTGRPRAEDGGTKPREMDAESSVAVVNDVLVVSTGNTVFSVRASDPDAKIRTTHRVDLGE